MTRLARPLADEIIRRSDEFDLSISEYVAAVLADALGMPQYAPVSLDELREQEELPLKTA